MIETFRTTLEIVSRIVAEILVGAASVAADYFW